MVNIDDKAKKEIRKYISQKATPDNPLKWWLENWKYFPQLARLARKYLCLPATSVPSERAFSIAGHVVNAKRACLLPDNANMEVFLAENIDK